MQLYNIYLNKVNKYSDAGLGILNYESDEETNRINLSLRDIFDATKTLERSGIPNVIFSILVQSLNIPVKSLTLLKLNPDKLIFLRLEIFISDKFMDSMDSHSLNI